MNAELHKATATSKAVATGQNCPLKQKQKTCPTTFFVPRMASVHSALYLHLTDKQTADISSGCCFQMRAFNSDFEGFHLK